MINLLWSGVLTLLLVSGCGWDGTPTRENDFIPLTSIEITADSSTLAKDTSTRLTATGNYSGLFTRDITGQAIWSSASSTVADFVPAIPGRVKALSPGTVVLTAAVGRVSSTFRVTVSPAVIQSMTITPAAPSIPKGLSTQLAVTGSFSDATTQDLTFDAAWSSNSLAVATVSDAATSKGFTHAVGVGAATISAAFGGASGTALVAVTSAVLQSVSVRPVNPSILSLSSGTFTATGSYSDGTAADITSQAAWSSSRTDTATISAGGAATTLTPGTTVISATSGGVSGSTSLKVTGGALAGITLSPASPKLVAGSAVRLTATGRFNNGGTITTRDITGAVAFSVTNPALASLTAPAGNLVWLNAQAITGSTAVSAKSGTLTGTASLTVTAPTIQSVVISPTSLDLTAGTSGRFTVTANFNDGSSQDVTADTDWTSSSPETAVAGNSGISKGRISGIAAGSATIAALYGGLTVTSPVTVATRTINTLTLSGISPVISGDQVRFIATANYFDATSKDVTEDTTWAINNPNVAILADSTLQPGQIVAVDGGVATLTATFGGKTSTATVAVP